VDLIVGLAHGFADLLSPSLIAACIVGLIAGVAAGFAPGLSPAGGLALAIPMAGVAAGLPDARSPVVLLISVAYGTLYGRALAAINANAAVAAASPGALLLRSDLSPVVRALIVAIAVAAGCGMFVAVFGPSLSIAMGPAEMFAIYMFLLLAGAAFARSSTATALAVIVLGLLLGTVGQDIETGIPRFTFGLKPLDGGLEVLVVAVGLFVIANLLDDLIRPETEASPQPGAVPRADSDHVEAYPACRK
jgi:TctA family transporter